MVVKTIRMEFVQHFLGSKKAVTGSDFFKLRVLALNKLEPFSVTVPEN